MDINFSFPRLCIAFSSFVMLAGCSVTQPVAEVTTKAVVMQLPGSFAKLEARQSCWEHAEEVHGQETDPERTAALNQEIESYQAMVEEALIYRAETVRLVERVRTTMDHGKTISGQDLTALNEGLAKHLALREQLFKMAELHECWLDANGPADAMSPEQRLKGIMISLSAALVLYDNYLLAISQYQEEPRLRMLLNNKDVGYGIDYGELNRVAMSFSSEENRNRVRRGIAYYEAAIENYPSLVAQDRYWLFLDQLITQSPSYSMTKRFSPLAYLGRKIGFYVPFTVETLMRLRAEGVRMASMIFGNTVGLVESRHGKLYGRKDVVMETAGEIKAGDMMIERTPFRLTNSFIPGRWGHAAIWIGTEVELRDLGIWDHPLVEPHHKAIKEGKSVVEALRPGVELNTLKDFMNVDDIAVLRLITVAPKEKADAILQALRQLGKSYDFNFNVETRDTVGCAELIYHAYGQFDWPTRKRLGRSTITPDDVAVMALDDGPLELVSLYNDGEKVTADLKQTLERMLAQPN